MKDTNVPVDTAKKSENELKKRGIGAGDTSYWEVQAAISKSVPEVKGL